ncbi:uncharacterized protein LOC109724281 [Ananas comosus]|uniref:Uncharacterized protein LOC109724281 n=1 Tax=Ananas comosus TaxID=4615 RepID=A0A6P5GRU1_ANACO|nr:uncharacterized protein LOC109724281 [Ananas comosus]
MVSSFSEKPLRRRSVWLAKEEGEEEEEEETKVSSTSNDNHNPSFRVYYAVTAGSVPFVWESEPGTPKKPAADDFNRQLLTLPPLTPPPSYYSANTKKSVEKSHKKFSLIKAVLPKLLGRKKPTAGPNRRFASPGSSFSGSSRGVDDDAEYSGCVDGSPTSTPCAWYVATPGRWWG